MGKSFAQIEATLPHSRKMRQLSHEQKWAYICAHLTPLGGFIGLFRYPKSVWANDASVSMEGIEAAILQLTTVGLVSHDDDEEFVRIVGWFLKKNAPENASRMASIAADFADIDAPPDLLMESAAEFVVGSIKRAQRWKADSVEWGKLRDVFKPFCANMRQNFEDDFLEALAGQMDGQNRAVKDELCALMPALQHHMDARCRHPAYTVGAHETETRRDETETDTKKRRDENYTAQNSREVRGPTNVGTTEAVRIAEKKARAQLPRLETIAAAKRIGAIG